MGITCQSGWDLPSRIRECMRDGVLAPFDSDGGTVEVDGALIGQSPDKPKKKGARGFAHKNEILTLFGRDTKQAKSIVDDEIEKDMLVPILRESNAM